MARKGLLVGAAVTIALLGAGGAVAWRSFQRDDDGVLVIAGTVESRDVQVGSLVGGRIEQVHVDEGDLVGRGAPLVTLEDHLLRRQVREQEARLDAARAEQALVEAGPRAEDIERARVEWVQAEAARQRAEELLRGEATTPARVEEAVARAESLRQTYEELRRGSRPEDLARARALAAQEEARLAFLREQLAELVVRAPARAVVQTLSVRPGDLVLANQPVAELLELDQLWVRAYVPETKLGLIEVGLPAEVEVDTFPGRPFAGTVVRINPRAEYTPRNVQTIEQREDMVFALRIDVSPTPLLHPGMTATVRLRPARAALTRSARRAR